jgi:hypothetical protein
VRIKDLSQKSLVEINKLFDSILYDISSINKSIKTLLARTYVPTFKGCLFKGFTPFLLSTDTLSAVPLPEEIYNTSGFVFDTDGILIPDGVTKIGINAMVRFEANSTGVREAFIYVNGFGYEGIGTASNNACATGTTRLNITSAPISVTQGDKIQLYVQHSAGVDINIETVSWLSIQVLE